MAWAILSQRQNMLKPGTIRFQNHMVPLRLLTLCEGFRWSQPPSPRSCGLGDAQAYFHMYLKIPRHLLAMCRFRLTHMVQAERDRARSLPKARGSVLSHGAVYPQSATEHAEAQHHSSSKSHCATSLADPLRGLPLVAATFSKELKSGLSLLSLFAIWNDSLR